MITALILFAVIATDIAVGVLFVTIRRVALTPPLAADGRRSAEMEELVIRLRAQAEQAVAELNRQKAQLHRIMAEFQRDQEPRVAQPAYASAPAQMVAAGYRAAPAMMAAAPAMASAPQMTAVAELEPQNVVRLAAEGLSERAIAGRTGTSVEAVRLMLAMAGSQATA